jgi:serine/threonine protein kinase
MQNCDNVMNEVGRKYAVGPILGKGTFGVVFLGRDLLRGRDVVIKRVPKFDVLQSREVEILNLIDHPNCIKRAPFSVRFNHCTFFIAQISFVHSRQYSTRSILPMNMKTNIL